MTSNTDAPERILAKAALGIEWEDTESAARRVAEYAADLATRQQAEAVGAACAGIIREAVGLADGRDEAAFIERRLMACLPDDATAALEARDARMWNEAIEAAVEKHESLWRETDAYKRDQIRALKKGKGNG